MLVRLLVMLEVHDLPSIVSLLHDRARSEGVGDCLPFAASFNEDFVACLDLKGLFDYNSSLQFTRYNVMRLD